MSIQLALSVAVLGAFTAFVPVPYWAFAMGVLLLVVGHTWLDQKRRSLSLRRMVICGSAGGVSQAALVSIYLAARPELATGLSRVPFAVTGAVLVMLGLAIAVGSAFVADAGLRAWIRWALARQRVDPARPERTRP